MRSPDGERWRVRRRWLDRPVDLRGRFRRNRREADDPAQETLFHGYGLPDFFDSPMGLAFGLGVALFLVFLFFILLPVLGVALELILILLLFTSGLFSRLVLGRPWTVEAINLDDGERSVAYAVKGFGDAGRAVTELSSALRADGPPERLSGGERTVLPRPTSAP